MGRETIEFVIGKDLDAGPAHEGCGNAEAGMAYTGKRTIIDEAGSAGRAAINEERYGASLLAGEGHGLVPTLDEFFGHIAARDFQHPGATGQHILSIHAAFDLGGWTGCRQATSLFGTVTDEPALGFPTFNQGIVEGFALAVITDRAAEETGTDEDLGGHLNYAAFTAI